LRFPDAAESHFLHEFTHSWNGQYRRPEGLATPDFQQPMKGELLWVYEGLTTYLGMVLAARSGLWECRADTRAPRVVTRLQHTIGGVFSLNACNRSMPTLLLQDLVEVDGN
jgi:predicted metalloprotease with PDZ domain